jgi:hypothetical protein
LKNKKRSPERESAFESKSVFVPKVLWKCYNLIVFGNFSDTRPEIAAFQRSLLRQVGPARKLAMLGQMNQTVKTLALSGLQSRYPDESPEMLRRRLADLILGSALASLVYGPMVDKR